ncbi:MAG: hypothetical protein FWC58_10360 [Desulfobulbus sp.]|nr:hypothetical protein [Desulfobulbus sp.]
MSNQVTEPGTGPKAGPNQAFAGKTLHPLADAEALRRIIADLPKDNAFKALDEVVEWLASTRNAGGLSVDRLYEAAAQLEDAVQGHVARLCRNYLHTSPLPRTEEERLWSLSHGYWQTLSDVYERCLHGLAVRGKAAENLKVLLPALCARQIAALGTLLKWDRFRYGPPAEGVWQRLGQTLLTAEAAGVATRTVTLSGGIASSPAREYQKIMIFHAASTDSLTPLEIELAERLIEHFLSGFVFTAEVSHDCVYWVDLQLAQPPLRLAQMPAEARPSQRFYRPGTAHAELSALLQSLESGGEAPADISLGGRYSGHALIPVLRHLVAYLAPIPPQRQHDRHRVKHRMSVLNGLVNAYVAFSDEFGGQPVGLQMESWEVDNVSRGGLGAVVSGLPADWLHVGALLSLRPDGGNNWLLGIVRRYFRETDNEARVGIETLARHALSVELSVRGAASAVGMPALLLENRGQPGEVRVVLPPDSFNFQESLECTVDGRHCLLLPAALLEHTADYELTRYYLRRA